MSIRRQRGLDPHLPGRLGRRAEILAQGNMGHGKPPGGNRRPGDLKAKSPEIAADGVSTGLRPSSELATKAAAIAGLVFFHPRAV